jgi:hypothetical protein
MKWFFQFLEKEYGVKPDATAGIIVTLAVFITGYVITLIAKAIAMHYQKVQYRKANRIIMSDYFKACKRQYKLHIESSLQTGFMSGTDFTVKLTPNPAYPYLSQINKTEFITKFRKLFIKNSIKAISKFFEILEYVKINDELFHKSFSSATERYSRNETAYYDNLNELRRLNDKFIGNIIEGNENEMLTRFVGIFEKWLTAAKPNSINNTYSEIVKPALMLGRTSMPSDNTRAIIDFSLACDIAFLNMEKSNIYLKQLLRNAAAANRRAYKLGEIIMKKL